jgi:prepilin-type N-terminal cleavage/methylation domain-containing protein
MRSFESSSGFSLIEVMVAAAILGCAVLSIAQLSVVSTRSTAGAREVSEATLLAWQKIDQLRALAWTFDDAGVSIGDAALAPAPAGVLTHDMDGWVDYLDAWGQPVGGPLDGGGGAAPPPGTRYRRRWSVAASGATPDLLILRARVFAIGRDDELAGAASLRARRRP